MKPRLLLGRLCDLCYYSWKAACANRFAKILFIKKQTQWSNDKTIIELGYRKISWFISVSQITRRSIICRSRRLRQIIDLLATDISRYFAQPRPIIAKHSHCIPIIPSPVTKGLFTVSWETLAGKWGNPPPVHIISHFNLIMFTW